MLEFDIPKNLYVCKFKGHIHEVTLASMSVKGEGAYTAYNISLRWSYNIEIDQKSTHGLKWSKPCKGV